MFIYEETNEHLLLGGYNYKLHQIDFFDLSMGKTEKMVPLLKEGPGAITSITKFIITPDYLIAPDNSGINFLDYNGHTVKKIDYKSYLNTNYLFVPTGFIPDFMLHLSYFQGSDHLYLPVFPNITKEYHFKDSHLGTEVNIHHDSIHFLPVYYPDFSSDDYRRYDNLLYPYFNDYKDFLIYNFPFQSNVFLFDKRTSGVTSHNPQSLYTPGKANAMEAENLREKAEYGFCSLRFREVYYSEKLNIFFRIHHEERESMKNRKRKSYLMLMDKNMKPVAEYVLPDEFDEHYVAHESSIYFSLNRDDDSQFSLGVINLEKIINDIP
jgi:hypothetical protein